MNKTHLTTLAIVLVGLLIGVALNGAHVGMKAAAEAQPDAAQ